MPRSSISLVSPFTRHTLACVRARLQPLPAFAQWQPGAAVLVPLCHVGGAPGILLEVRGQTRAHAHEISFPGGAMDDGESPAAAAVRETQEELGIPSDHVELLGTFGPLERSRSGMNIWPFVGWIHAEPSDLSSDLRSIEMRSLMLSQAEVKAAFHLPLYDLAQGNPRLKRAVFRGDDAKPYYAADAADYLTSAWAGPDRPEVVDIPRKEVWGLTGWYLNLFMRQLGLWTQPPPCM